MKKGCFLTTVIVGTVAIGVIFYIAENYGDEILNFGKDQVQEMTFDSAEEYFDKIQKSEYKDSLKTIWKDVFDEAKKMEFDEGMNYISSVILQIKKAASDSLINLDELKKIKEFAANEKTR